MSADSRGRLARVPIAAGAVLGIAAGVTAATVGSRIPEWTGAKADPTALGLLTVVLCALALALAVRLPHLRTRDQRQGALVFVVVVGLLFFTTVGRLWWVPGPLLLLGAALEVSPRTDLSVPNRTGFVQVLIAVLGSVELVMAASASVAIMVTGVVGGVALIACGWLLARSTVVAAALLVVGTVPFVLVAWSAIVPVLVLVLASGLVVPELASRRHARADSNPRADHATARSAS